MEVGKTYRPMTAARCRVLFALFGGQGVSIWNILLEALVKSPTIDKN
jgi:hypothetical protein